MPYDARAVANLLLDEAYEAGVDLTHLALQKVMYFAHAWTLVETGQPLIGQRFEAWKFGPVQRVVYEQFKGSDQPLGERRADALDVETGEITVAEAAFADSDLIRLRSLVRYYGKFHAGKLVDLTHEEGGPWDRVWRNAEREAIPGMRIDDHAIREWFVMIQGQKMRSRH